MVVVSVAEGAPYPSSSTEEECHGLHWTHLVQCFLHYFVGINNKWFVAEYHQRHLTLGEQWVSPGTVEIFYRGYHHCSCVHEELSFKLTLLLMLCLWVTGQRIVTGNNHSVNLRLERQCAQ